MRLIPLLIIIYVGVCTCITSERSQCEIRFDSCVSNTDYRTQAETSAIVESIRILNSVRVYSQVGTGVYDLLSVPATSRLPLRQFLTDVIPDIFMHITSFNVSSLEPFYDEGFQLIDDLFYRIISFNLNDVDRSVSNLVMTLDDSFTFVIDFVNNVFSDPNTEIILKGITSIRNISGLKDNATCLLQQIVRDPNVEDIVAYVELLSGLIDDIASFVSPIARLFRNNNKFIDKFDQIIQQLNTSLALKLCVDSMLTNLACPQFEDLVTNGVCGGTCADTLKYCSAFFFQSLDDFSDVFDAAGLLVFEEAVSTEFEIFYNESIDLSLEVLNTTLFALERLDIEGLVNTSITTCQSESIISELPQMFNFTIPPGEVIQFFNDLIPESPLENMTDIYNMYLNLTRSIPFQNIRDYIQSIETPRGFLVNALFDLSIRHNLDYYPPLGCSSGIRQLNSVLMDLHIFYEYDCWDGTMVVNFLSSPTFISALVEDVGNNSAALRTCSYSNTQFIAARLLTSANLCDKFTNVIGDARIANFLSTILSSDPTALSTCRVPLLQLLNAPIPPAPIVNFQLSTYFATINAPLTAICVAVGNNVQLQIFSLNGTDLNFTVVPASMSESPQITLNFTPSTIATYIFTCQGSNSAGDTRSRTIIIVRSFSDNLVAISNFTADSIIEPAQAIELLSVLTSIPNTKDVQNNSTSAQQFADTTFAVADSLENTNISTNNAGALLGALESVENLPILTMTTNSPPESGETEINLEVSEITVRVSQTIDRLSLNLAQQTQIGAPPTIVPSSGITIAALAIQPSNRLFTLELPELRVSFPSNFGNLERIEVGVAIRNSLLRAQVQVGQQVVVGSIPLLNSNLLNLNIEQNGNPNVTFEPPIIFELKTSLIPPGAENICVFLDENSQLFRQGDVMTGTASLAANVTMCQTSHLTSFGVLVRAQSIQLSKAETLAISIVSYILLSISLIFLLASITLFLISAKSFFKVETNILYFNYAVSLTLATSVFIFGIQTARNSYIGCTVVGFLLHYTWLSVFSWSFAISLFMVYILYFGILNRKKIWWLMMIIGWGLPLPIVIPTIAVGLFRNVSFSALDTSRNEYVNIGDHCFLSYTNGLIWAFLGPFVLLISASSIGGILSLMKIFLTMRDKEKKPKDFDVVVNLVVTVLVLLPVLSIPWIIGIANVFITSAVTVTLIEWVMIIFTAPVGILFFIMVVLRNPQVQDVLKKKNKKTYSISKKSSNVPSNRIARPRPKRSVTTTIIENPYNQALPAVEGEKEVLGKIYEVEPPQNIEHNYEQMTTKLTETVKDVEKDESHYENSSLDVTGDH